MIEAISGLGPHMSEALKSIGETLSEGFGQRGAAVEQVQSHVTDINRISKPHQKQPKYPYFN